MIEVIVGCLFPMMLTPDILSDYQECRVTEEHIENVRKNIIEAGQDTQKVDFGRGD